MAKIIELGNKVRVSDPCYGTEVWCSGVLENVKEGAYNVEVMMSDEGMWGKRVKALAVIHTDYKGPLHFTERADFEVGVDSGQAGIYDEEYYNQYHTVDDCDEDWYDAVCDLTDPYGTKDGKCVVSSSGFGDGGYDCFTIVENGEIVAIMILYIPDEDDDTSYDDEEEEDYEDEEYDDYSDYSEDELRKMGCFDNLNEEVEYE